MTDLVLVVSVLALSAGAALIFAPAGLIVLGTLGIAGSIYYAKGSE